MPIFGLRFKSNEAIQPTAIDLTAFLDTPRAPGSRERHRDDLAPYVDYLARIEQYEAGKGLGLAQLEFGERMFLGVLSHSRFFNPSLRKAVEEYKYHYHQLRMLDLNKPASFIRSAEDEITRLNPKKRDDQAKITRLQDLIAQRARDLAKLEQRWDMLAGELHHIAVYIAENLIRIRQLCETTIGRLAELQVGGEKTAELIEDVKTHFKEQVRDSLQAGPVTKEYIAALQAEVAELTKALSKQVLEDLYTITGIYETVYEHAKTNADELQRLIDRTSAARKRAAGRSADVFGSTERALAALIGRFRIEPRGVPDPDAANGHTGLLLEKRQEMLFHIFELLREEKRPWRS